MLRGGGYVDKPVPTEWNTLRGKKDPGPQEEKPPRKYFSIRVWCALMFLFVFVLVLWCQGSSSQSNFNFIVAVTRPDDEKRH